MSASGKPKSNACPFRCYETTDMAGAEASLLSMATESQRQSQAQEPQSQAFVEESQAQHLSDDDLDPDEQPIIR